MKNLLKRFLRDDAGFVISSELVLVATILVIGMITGLTTLRDGVIQELGDLGSSIGSVSQSYMYFGVIGHSSSTSGSTYSDNIDFCDEPVDPADGEPACLNISVVPVIEQGPPAPIECRPLCEIDCLRSRKPVRQPRREKYLRC